VEAVLNYADPAAVFVPTHGEETARSIASFRHPVWIIAVSSQESTCQQLQFSSGVHPLFEPEHPENWNTYVCDWLTFQGIEGRLAVLTEGPSSKYPEANNRRKWSIFPGIRGQENLWLDSHALNRDISGTNRCFGHANRNCRFFIPFDRKWPAPFIRPSIHLPYY
jgi:hypothetical protein